MALNVRKFVLRAHSLDELLALGTLTPHAARFLEAADADTTSSSSSPSPRPNGASRRVLRRPRRSTTEGAMQ
jgi:hypothetical protein